METIHLIFLGLAYFAAIGFLVFGLDDLFVDLQFLRYLRKRDGKDTVSLEALKNEPEQLIAVFIPAWQESGVIDRMVDFATKVLIYDRYDIFIGVYPNDADTIRCVEELARKHPRVHLAMTRQPGPTSKADCLNTIYRAMKAREIPGQREYQLIVLHDAEDVLHPLTLKVYNHYVPRRFDMGQIPVFPLELTPWRHWVGNTYVDEFTELHLKDMYAREHIGGVVPSAGVGTAFSRRAIEHLAAKHGGGPFEVGQLAEDYMVGLELCRAGFRAGFIDYPVERTMQKRDEIGKVIATKQVTELVAVREHFPTKFSLAVRQKARWIVGTAFQGWEKGGWWGSPAIRYTLARDRKAPLVHSINMAGYCVVVYVVAGALISVSPWSQTWRLPSLFAPDGLLWRIVLLDLGLLTYRVVQKVSFVSRIYGWRHALFAIPRYPVGNFVNMVATVRAARLYLGHRLLGRELGWAKTTHAFPGEQDLVEFSRSIEDLLVDEGYVSRKKLEDVLKSSPRVSAPEALLRLNLIDEEQFTNVWAKYSGLEPRVVVPEEVPPAFIGQWTEELALKHQAMPSVYHEGDGAEFVFVEPPSADTLRAAEEVCGVAVTPRLLRPANLAFLCRRVYPDHTALARRPDPLWGAWEKLPPSEARRVREFQALRNRSLADAMVALELISSEEARLALARSAGSVAADLRGRTVDEAMVIALGPLFCQVHGLVPLNGGGIAVASMPHPDTVGRLRERLGTEPALCTDLPEVFLTLWRQMSDRREAEHMLVNHLMERRILTSEMLERVRQMQILVSEPLDRLLVQVGMATRSQIRDALLATSGLQSWPVGTGEATEPPGIQALLAPGFSKRAGIVLVEVVNGRAAFGLRSLPSSDDLLELFDRCAGAAITFRINGVMP